jgi:hypothetical protein
MVAALPRALRTPPSAVASRTRLLTRSAPKMSCTALTVPDMDKPPCRYDVTVRVTKEDGHSPDPATFAAAASQAASSRNASIVSAHTAQEVICVVCVAAPDRPSAVAVALAVVADALSAGNLVRSPSL